MTTAKSFRVAGLEGAIESPATREVAISSNRRLLPRGLREAGASELAVQADEVVRMELDNGFVLWTRADDLIAEHGTRVLGRGGEPAWEIVLREPSRIRQPSERGWLKLGIRVLDFFGIDLAGKTAKALSLKFEAKQLGGNPPGLYRCQMRGDFSLLPVDAENPVGDGQGPILVFLHGTASSTKGSFGKLWEAQNAQGEEARRVLGATYGERVYAFEHRSLTQSPIQNALELAKRLPQGAPLHLVSHSRGGLVGELLCLGQRDKQNDPLKSDYTELFQADRTMARQLGLKPLDSESAKARDEAYQKDRGMLEALRDLLDRKEIQVTRFVRVACPARGTTLASGRLDRWLSVLDFISGKGFFGDALDFLLAVVKERTDPRTLPGLEAMMPGSALTRLLHHPHLKTGADLSVISGDIEGETLWGQIKLLATDWFYGADHDLVVNTGSMYGGIRRKENGARFQFDQGAAVCHFNYFENRKSINWLVSGLTRSDAGDGGFQPIEKAKHEEPRWREAVRRSRATDTPRPLAVVLPGTMGSALRVDGAPVWLNYWALMWGGLARLKAPGERIAPTDLLDQFYGPLLEFLARSHRVEIFPYNWRDSVRDAAQKLADRIEVWLPDAERRQQPVHIIAHSMGGLVVRAMMGDGARGAELWRRIAALPNSRFMMLGTPNHGSYEAMRWLTGFNPTQAKLALLDLKNDLDAIINIVREFPGLLELLPFAAGDPDFSQPDLWRDLKQQLAAEWETAREADLAEARTTWDALGKTVPDPKLSVYVAGSQRATVADYQLVPYEESYLSGRKRLDFQGTAEGDGTVTWASGAIGSVPVWYVEDTAHDELCAKKRAFPGYLELLMTGATTRLSKVPPLAVRAGRRPEGLFSMPSVPPSDGIPDEESLRSFGFGPSRPFDPAAAGRGVPTITVSIRHGDLAYASHPVLVGHYWGDTIVSAEEALDRRLDKMLSERRDLGIYPGRLGTHALFFNRKKDARPGGAIVVGLGQVGEISPNLLTSCVRDALLDYALKAAQWPDDRFGPIGGSRSVRITSLLVATGAGGMTVRDSVCAILRGATTVNRKLVDARMEDRVVIDRIEFIELFEDVAITAAEALEAAMADGELDLALDWPARVVEAGQGGRHRIQYGEAEGWWQRLEITCEEESDLLRFIATTDRARAEETLATGQLRLADRFIRQAAQSSSANPEVAKTLFEMLLPNRLKEQAPKQDDLVLLLDGESARFPWELLEDRWSHAGRPPAVASGLIRQCKTPKFRPHPAHAVDPTALVIGNPDLEGWNAFGDLPGARSEAQKVLAMLNANGFRAVGCIDERTDAILSGLHQDAWRILHLAGHGVHAFEIDDPLSAGDPENLGKTLKGLVGREAGKASKPISGMVIGKSTILTPGDVEQMRWVPELVFINCCHLGKTGPPSQVAYGLLAANLAMQFIDMGVKAVVAAGWAVDDGAAEAFAETFYRRLLSGEAFGEAVRAARQEIWLRFSNVNTWGAYQCYGDPAFRLHGDGPPETKKEKRAYFTPHELIADLDNHTQWIRMQMQAPDPDGLSLAAMGEQIGKFLKRVPESHREEWPKRADVAAALGFAWGETGAYRKAADWLQKAITADRGDCPMRAVEQAANFKVRAAATAWQNLRRLKGGEERDGKRRKLLEEVGQALDTLERLVQTGKSIERLNLLGGAFKRQAYILETREDRQKALESMMNTYRGAYDLDATGSTTPDPYAFTNYALARVLLERIRKSRAATWKQALVTECHQTIDIARRRYEKNPDFWGAVAEADTLLVLLLANPNAAAQKMDEDAKAIVEKYRDAGLRGTSPRQMASIGEHLDFILEVYEAPNARIEEALVMIRNAI
jgi:tetratricopeptide (TPR) repeat protein